MNEIEKNIKTKGFKVTDAEKKYIDDLLQQVNDDGSSQTDKIISALELLVHKGSVGESLKNVPNSIKLCYEGDREKLKTALAMIESVYDTLILSTTEVIKSNEQALVEGFQKKIQDVEFKNDILQKQNDELTEKLKVESEKNAELNHTITILNNSNSEYEKMISSMKAEFEHRLEQELSVIESLKQTIISKETLLDNLSKQKADSDSSLAKMVQKAEKQSEEFEKTNAENKRLQDKMNEIITANIQLNNEKIEMQTKLAYELSEFKTKMEYEKEKLANSIEQMNEYREEVKYYKSEYKQLMSEYNKLANSKTLPTAEKPTAEKPTAEKPTAEKPTAEKPTAKKPTAKKPTAEKPTAEKPTAEKPTAKKPTANNSKSTD